MGEIRKEPATPNDPHKAAKAVAVVRSSDGNQLADNKGGAACVTGPAKPFKNWPAPIDLKLNKKMIEFMTGDKSQQAIHTNISSGQKRIPSQLKRHLLWAGLYLRNGVFSTLSNVYDETFLRN